MNWRTLIAGLATLAALLVGLATWDYYGPRLAGPPLPPQPGNRPKAAAHKPGGMQVTAPTQISLVDDEGHVVWEADFDGDMKLDQEKGLLTGADVTCRILLGAQQTLTVKAKQLTAEQARRSLRFSEDAEARLEPDGSAFKADSFEWVTDQRLLTAAGGVEVRHQGALLRGDRLEANLVAQKARVEGHAVAAYGSP
jgi:hypothetical protein